jgi:hypothetical protein
MPERRTLIRRRADAAQAGVLQGKVSPYMGEVVGLSAAVDSRDPMTGEIRPALMGVCPVCNCAILADQGPTEVRMIEGGQQRWIHGSFDCMDQPVCTEVVRGNMPGTGEWSIHCLLPANHPGDCYWSEA